MKNYFLETPEAHLEFRPRTYICPRAPFALGEPDGDLDKPFWKDAPFSDLFVDIEWERKPKPYHETRMKMLWDDQYLYIGAYLKEDQPWGRLTERDCVVFEDNDFEVFIDPDGDTHNYYELEMNILNTLWDLFLPKPYRDNGMAVTSWDIQGIKSAVKIDGVLNSAAHVATNQGWSVELCLPWKVLRECAPGKRGPVFGEYWRIDFSRVEWRTHIEGDTFAKDINPETNKPYPEDNWIWSPTGVINMHYPELWGFLYFAHTADEKFTIPADEYLKWELRKVYYAQKAYFAQHGAYCTDARQLFGGANTISPKIEATSTMYEASIPTSDGRGKIIIYSDSRCVIEA